MKTITIKLDDDVQKVLNNSEITGKSLVLPEGLERSLYVKVNKVIQDAGGKWNRAAKAHVFQEEPAKIFSIIKNGEYIDEKKAFQAFFTPPELAKYLVDLANPKDCNVLEPSAGEGSLVDEILKQSPKAVLAVELNEKSFKKLEEKYNKNSIVSFLEGDFLNIPIANTSCTDKVIMNPPFDNNTWVKHISHAYKHLKNGGTLYSICPNSPTNKHLLKFLEGKNYKIEQIKKGAFQASGTMISTMILIVEGEYQYGI